MSHAKSLVEDQKTFLLNSIEALLRVGRSFTPCAIAGHFKAPTLRVFHLYHGNLEELEANRQMLSSAAESNKWDYVCTVSRAWCLTEGDLPHAGELIEKHGGIEQVPTAVPVLILTYEVEGYFYQGVAPLRPYTDLPGAQEFDGLPELKEENPEATFFGNVLNKPKPFALLTPSTLQ